MEGGQLDSGVCAEPGAGVEEDSEKRIGDGEDCVVEVSEGLRQDPALEEDPDMEAARVAAEASDEFFTFLCGIIVILIFYGGEFQWRYCLTRNKFFRYNIVN
jgi:hypothetical protein